MQLDELTYDEQMALGGLVRLMVRSDGDFSEAEEAALERVGTRIAGGLAPLWKVISASAQRFPSDDAILAAAKSVDRDEARLMIRTVLEEIAASDLIAETEHNMLLWLQDAWR